MEFAKPNLNAKTDEAEQGPQPAFQSLALDQFKKMTDQLLQTEIDLMDNEARLQFREDESQRGSDLPREQHDQRLRPQIAEIFKHDPEVVALTNQIKSTMEELEQIKRSVKKGHDPARIRAEQRLVSLKSTYEELWQTKSSQIHDRLLVETATPGSGETLVSLKQKINSLKLTKKNLLDLLGKYKQENQSSATDAVKATFVRNEVNSLTGMNDSVNRKIEQLTFESSKGMQRVFVVDRGSCSQHPFSQ